MALQSYRDLLAWQKGMDLVEAIYRLSALFPREELYGLTSQVRRAAVSIPSNIAEGQGRQTTRDFLHFLGMAYGSLCEAETQVLVAQRLRFLPDAQVALALDTAGDVGRLINGLRNALEAKLAQSS